MSANGFAVFSTSNRPTTTNFRPCGFDFVGASMCSITRTSPACALKLLTIPTGAFSHSTRRLLMSYTFKSASGTIWSLYSGHFSCASSIGITLTNCVATTCFGVGAFTGKMCTSHGENTSLRISPS